MKTFRTSSVSGFEMGLGIDYCDAPRTLIENDAAESVPVLEPSKEHRSVPLTIICGFLGAGKSTLVKYIQSRHHCYTF